MHLTKRDCPFETATDNEDGLGKNKTIAHDDIFAAASCIVRGCSKTYYHLAIGLSTLDM
jgi:hypothetical protein